MGVPKGSTIGLVLALAAISALRLQGYLLFHTFAELFSVVIAATYAVIAWHTRRVAGGSSIGALGIAYFFVALLDTVHTLSFDRMGIFVGYYYPANQVWVIARSVEASALCVFSFVDLRSRFQSRAVLLAYTAVTVGGLASIFVFRSFPACFVAGQGQTTFKVAAEVFIIALLVAAAVVLNARKRLYSPAIHRLLQLSIGVTALSELSFMVYVHNFDALNLAGHLLKIVSFYLVYRAVVVTCLERPQEILFDQLSRTAEQLRTSNEAKDSFISILSHDLRGPLSGIRSIAQLYAEEDAGDTDDRARVVFAEIGKAADASLRLVERVLDWAKSRGGSLEPVPRELDAGALIDTELEPLRKLAESKGVAVRTEYAKDGAVFADGDMLGTIVRNLIQNAVKFTAAGGSVAVSLKREGAAVSIEIADSGVGMSQETVDRLFDAAERVTMPGTDGEKGSGFGLVLCAEFAVRMGGRLAVSSRPGEGSVFRLTLPAISPRR
jgi:signal transduction histidine kinase